MGCEQHVVAEGGECAQRLLAVWRSGVVPYLSRSRSLQAMAMNAASVQRDDRARDTMSRPCLQVNDMWDQSAGLLASCNAICERLQVRKR